MSADARLVMQPMAPQDGGLNCLWQGLNRHQVRLLHLPNVFYDVQAFWLQIKKKKKFPCPLTHLQVAEQDTVSTTASQSPGPLEDFRERML